MGADVSLLHRFLGHIYHIDITTIDPPCLGWACARMRQFCRMRHKVKDARLGRFNGLVWPIVQ